MDELNKKLNFYILLLLGLVLDAIFVLGWIAVQLILNQASLFLQAFLGELPSFPDKLAFLLIQILYTVGTLSLVLFVVYSDIRNGLLAVSDYINPSRSNISTREADTASTDKKH